MANWKVVYYRDLEDKCEIDDFLNALKSSQQAKILAWIDLLEQEGPTLPRPFADFLRDGIHELRIKISGNQIRIIYFFIFQDYIILTHPFVKSQKKVPDNEINKALKINNEFRKRFKDKRQFEIYLKENSYD